MEIDTDIVTLILLAVVALVWNIIKARKNNRRYKLYDEDGEARLDRALFSIGRKDR